MTYPMLLRSVTGAFAEMSSPSISTRPLDGSTMRLIMRSRVVLPLPDEPTSTVVLRDGISRLKSSTARVPSSNCFVTDTNSILILFGSFLVTVTNRHAPDHRHRHALGVPTRDSVSLLQTHS
jgi:hypothetical protein